MNYIISGTYFESLVAWLVIIALTLLEINQRKDSINSHSTANEKNTALVYTVSSLRLMIICWFNVAGTQVYDLLKDFLEKVVDVNFGIGGGKKGKLILLGGIQINMPTHMMDYFEPLIFEVRTKDEPSINLLKEAFGIQPL
jgi:hypothetical protein